MLFDLGSIETMLPHLERDTLDRIAIAAASAGMCSTELMQSIDFLLRTLQVAEQNRFEVSQTNPSELINAVLAYGDEKVARNPRQQWPDTLRTLHSIAHLGCILTLEAQRIIDRFADANDFGYQQAAEASIA